MKTLPKTLTLLFLFAANHIALGEAKPIGSFIRDTGDYDWSDSQRFILIEQKDASLQYTIKIADSERHKSLGPKAGLLTTDKSWFFWIESRDSIWMFDGEDRLWNYSFEALGKNTYRDRVYQVDKLSEVPKELLRELPEKFTKSEYFKEAQQDVGEQRR